LDPAFFYAPGADVYLLGPVIEQDTHLLQIRQELAFGGTHYLLACSTLGFRLAFSGDFFTRLRTLAAYSA
jgi:hypothetical protein